MAANGDRPDDSERTPPGGRPVPRFSRPSPADPDFRKVDIDHLPWEMRLLFIAARELDATIQARGEETTTTLQELRRSVQELTASVNIAISEGRTQSQTIGTMMANVMALQGRQTALEASQKGQGETADVNFEKHDAQLAELRAQFNKAHPDRPDIEDPTGVYSVARTTEAILQAKLTQRDLESVRARLSEREAELKRHEEQRTWLTRQTLIWIVAAMGFVLATIITALVTVVLTHR